MVPSQDSNLRPVNRKSDAVPTAPPTFDRQADDVVDGKTDPQENVRSLVAGAELVSGDGLA